MGDLLTQLEGNLSRFPPHDDGLTEDHLSFLGRSLDRSEFVAERYSGRGEGGRYGPNVDFEWWIEHDGEVLGLRYQAKVIDVDLLRFSDIDRERLSLNALIRVSSGRQPPGRGA